LRVWTRSDVTEWREVRELKAPVEGRGISSERETSIGRRVSMVSGSGGGTSGERRGKVRLCSCRVWWDRCVVRAEWAVINLG